MKSIENQFGILTLGFGHNTTLSDFVLRCREHKEMLRKNFVTCCLVRLKERDETQLRKWE